MLTAQEYVKSPEFRELWDKTPVPPPRGQDFKADVHDAVFEACMDHADFDVSVLDKAEQDELYSLCIDLWKDWPEDLSDDAEQQIVQRLKSLAVVGDFGESVRG